MYGQRWAGLDGSRLIGWGWVIWLVGGCGYACRSRDECGSVLAYMGKGGQVWMGHTDQAGMDDSRWVWVCVQV